MFKFRPTMTTLEKRENPADFQPMYPIFLTPVDKVIEQPSLGSQTTPTAPTTTTTTTTTTSPTSP